MSLAELPIVLVREKIARFCRERGIRKFSLFGCVLRDDSALSRSTTVSNKPAGIVFTSSRAP